MPLPIDTRKKPSGVKVHVSTGAGVNIIWADGHSSHYDFVYLRDNCPCALCDDDRKKKAPLAGSEGVGPANALLPMFKPKAKAKSPPPIVNDAIQIDFTDAHSTGIYSTHSLST